MPSSSRARAVAGFGQGLQDALTQGLGKLAEIEQNKDLEQQALRRKIMLTAAEQAIQAGDPEALSLTLQEVGLKGPDVQSIVQSLQGTLEQNRQQAQLRQFQELLPVAQTLGALGPDLNLDNLRGVLGLGGGQPAKPPAVLSRAFGSQAGNIAAGLPQAQTQDQSMLGQLTQAFQKAGARQGLAKSLPGVDEALKKGDSVGALSAATEALRASGVQSPQRDFVSQVIADRIQQNPELAKAFAEARGDIAVERRTKRAGAAKAEADVAAIQREAIGRIQEDVDIAGQVTAQIDQIAPDIVAAAGSDPEMIEGLVTQAVAQIPSLAGAVEAKRVGVSKKVGLTAMRDPFGNVPKENKEALEKARQMVAVGVQRAEQHLREAQFIESASELVGDEEAIDQLFARLPEVIEQMDLDPEMAERIALRLTDFKNQTIQLREAAQRPPIQETDLFRRVVRPGFRTSPLAP